MADIGTPPAIDRLQVVADREDPAGLAGQQPDQRVLGMVGVLVLVDQDLGPAGRPMGGQRRVGLHGRDWRGDQVVEVERLALRQGRLVGRQHGRRLRQDLRLEPGQCRGAGQPAGLGHQAVLQQRHRLLQQAGLLRVLDPAGLHQQRPGVALAEDGEAARQPRHAGAVLDQQPGHDGVEGADPAWRLLRAEQGREPAAHLAGRLGGEGDAEQPVRCLAGEDEVGHPPDQRLGLAGAGAGQHQQGGRRGRGGALRRVQAGEVHGHQEYRGSATAAWPGAACGPLAAFWRGKGAGRGVGPPGGLARPGMALIGHQAQLHRRAGGDLDRQLQRHGPEALDPVLAAQRKEDHPLDPAGLAGLDGQAEGKVLGGCLAQRQGQLLDLHLLPLQRALGRLVGGAAVEAHRYAMAVRSR